ncbi:MAG: WXG100 family type VII secretion target [Marmoricola sp.]
MSFTTDHAAMQRASTQVQQITEELEREKATLHATVSDLLGGGWTGVAADEYRKGWADWCDGADEVFAGLREASTLLSQTRAAYQTSDEDAEQRTAPISSRLQDRLG